jgi:hypothetical protein
MVKVLRKGEQAPPSTSPLNREGLRSLVTPFAHCSRITAHSNTVLKRTKGRFAFIFATARNFCMQIMYCLVLLCVFL